MLIRIGAPGNVQENPAPMESSDSAFAMTGVAIVETFR